MAQTPADTHARYAATVTSYLSIAKAPISSDATPDLSLFHLPRVFGTRAILERSTGAESLGEWAASPGTTSMGSRGVFSIEGPFSLHAPTQTNKDNTVSFAIIDASRS